jgi:hypothetical protein
MIPIVGSVLMGLCSLALFWATTRMGRARRSRAGRAELNIEN